MVLKRALLIGLIVIWFSTELNGARILGAFIFPAKSHYIVTNAVMTELAKRGHEVTVITCFRQDEKTANFSEIIIEPIFDIWGTLAKASNNLNVFQMTDATISHTLKMTNLMGDQSTEYALKHPEFQKFLRDTTREYDLLIVEQFFQEAFLMLAHQYNVPIVSLSTFGFSNTLSGFMGQVTPWSHSPHSYYPFSDRMTFFERLHNGYVSFYTEINKHFLHMPQQNKLAQKYFAHLPGPLPSIWDLERNISVVLMNNYVPLEWPRAQVMGMVSVGGVHIKPPRTLQRDIRQFIDEAHNGVIYFSLGTNVDSSQMPAAVVAIFLKVFSKLKERILWKWGNENIPDLPRNVMVKKWMPQNDILAHPHIKLFITHGGLLSVQEAVYRSVPMLGIPFYGDQFLNTKKAVDGGYGLLLNFENITEISLTWALQQLLRDPSYLINIRSVSQIFRDRQTSALETAMYWIEYVIRHKGAPHIKSSAVYLPWYSLYMIDVMAVVIAGISAIVFSLYSLKRILSHLKNDRREKLYSKIS